LVHTGALSVTPETGSPIAETGIEAPNFSAVQSASVITLFPGWLAGIFVCALIETALKTKISPIAKNISPAFLLLPTIIVLHFSTEALNAA
jgi:hypothetical protein